MKRTLYEVLGVDHEAPAEEIAAAFAKRIEELNAAPSQDHSALALARDARDILSDTYLRTAYDASLARPAAPTAVAEPVSEQVPISPLVQYKWPIAAGVLFLMCAMWFALSRPSRSPQIPAAPVAVEPSPAPAQEESLATDTAVRSPKDVFNEVSAGVVRVNVMDSASRLVDSVSGVVSAPGVVITNCHVAVPGTTLTVKGRGEAMPATIQVADEQLNLCRLAVPGLDAPPVTMGSIWSLRQGQRVLAIGAPGGQEAPMRDGIVSVIVQTDHGAVIHTTAPISAGFSGGGLFDFSGHLVGIATAYHPYGANINVALPADWIGQMQARALSASGAQADVLQDNQDISESLIAGRWICFGSIAGRNGDYTFRDDGRVLVMTSQGPPIDSRYSVSKRALQFSSATQRTTFSIESFARNRMVWQLGGAQNRVVCDRR